MKLLLGDCLEVLRDLPDNSVDSIVTDPPYGLGKEPDALKMLTDWIETGHHDVKGRGFMGKEWDAFVPQPRVWHECLRVLKPGGHLLAFAGTRTQDLMTLGLRLAGFEIRDMVAWVYGSGFPKSLDVSKAIDGKRGDNGLIRPWLLSLGSREDLASAAGVTPRQIDHYLGSENSPCPQTLTFEKFARLCEHFDTVPEWADDMFPKKGAEIGTIRHSRSGGDDFAKRPGSPSTAKDTAITAPATDAAKQWDGWGTALKPALEPITLARKPLEGTVAANVLKWHTGALNIDGCRVEGLADKPGTTPPSEGARNSMAGALPRQDFEPNTKGRWPANLIHDGSDEVLAGFPDSKGAQGDVKGTEASRTGGDGTNCYGEYGRIATPKRGDSGSAARFFYCAKTSKADRNEGLEDAPDAVLARSCQAIAEAKRGNTVETEGGAFNKARVVKNNHPTVKPTALMQYLCRLITPPGGVILDPYMGSGSTGKAANLEGFQFIGIERDPDYFKIAEARILGEAAYEFF
jgi:DNA modification methylase